jgi:hypothetical protein
MTYTEEKYSDVEAAAIMAEARANILQWRAEDTRRRDGAGWFVTKTLDEARVADVPAPTMDAKTAAWAEWVDARIEEKCSRITEALEALSESCVTQQEKIQAALDQRDAAIQGLRDEIEIKIGLGRKLARLKAEVAEARRLQPNFEGKLNVLQGQIEKQQKTISKLRVENSQLAFAQKQMDAELSQMRRKSASSAAVVQFETSNSRITVGNLHPDAANALREFASQVIDAQDGGAILFSGPAGTA